MYGWVGEKKKREKSLLKENMELYLHIDVLYAQNYFGREGEEEEWQTQLEGILAYYIGFSLLLKSGSDRELHSGTRIMVS